MNNEELFNGFIEGKKFGIEILYETAVFSLENCGYISQIQDNGQEI